MSTTRSVLFGERAAGVYLLTDIYDPDVDGTSPSASGKIVPAVGSLVIDNTVGLHNQQYTVTAVNQETYKSTMIPSTFVVDSTAQVDRVLSYGNDLFMLYISAQTLTISGSNINLRRLIVDNKLCLFGNHAATYQLVKIGDNGQETVISRKYMQGSKQLDVISGTVDGSTITAAGTAISMLKTGVDGIRKCDGCYTDAIIEEGDLIRCDIYTAAGMLITQVNLVAKQAHLLNETVSTSNPITHITIEGNQMQGGNLMLYRNQSIEELAIFVVLHYADGHTATIAVDGERGFVYGLESVVTNVINESGFDILVKYYLSQSDACGLTDEYVLTTDATVREGKRYFKYNATSNRYVEQTNLEVGRLITSADQFYELIAHLEEDSVVRFLTASTKLVVVSSDTTIISKISPIPYWDGSKYQLKILRYRSDRSISPTTDDGAQSTVVTGFSGTVLDTIQTVTFETSQLINGVNHTFLDSAQIKLFNHQIAGSSRDHMFWLISRDDGETFYGDITNAHVRPVVKYKANIGYYIPTSEGYFSGNSDQSPVEQFIENFYTLAKPPTIEGEAVAPVPTHFTVKNGLSGEQILDQTAIVKYVLTTDAIVAAGKTYYKKEGDLYVVVSNPVDAEIATYYEVKQNFGYNDSLTGADPDGKVLAFDTISGAGNMYTGTTLIFEFLRVDPTNNTEEILYGVPVDCIQG